MKTIAHRHRKVSEQFVEAACLVFHQHTEGRCRRGIRTVHVAPPPDHSTLGALALAMSMVTAWLALCWPSERL